MRVEGYDEDGRDEMYIGRSPELVGWMVVVGTETLRRHFHFVNIPIGHLISSRYFGADRRRRHCYGTVTNRRQPSTGKHALRVTSTLTAYHAVVPEPVLSSFRNSTRTIVYRSIVTTHCPTCPPSRRGGFAHSPISPPTIATPSTNAIDAPILSAPLFCEADAEAEDPDPDIVAVAEPEADPEAACDDPADVDEIVAFAAISVEFFFTTT
jgi:hypothetical protein